MPTSAPPNTQASTSEPMAKSVTRTSYLDNDRPRRSGAPRALTHRAAAPVIAREPAIAVRQAKPRPDRPRSPVLASLRPAHRHQAELAARPSVEVEEAGVEPLASLGFAALQDA